MKDVVILAAARTPVGAYQGAFSTTPATRLGATAVKAAAEKAKLPLDAIDECLMGCVLPAGLGQAPARQAALFAKMPQSVRCTTVNRVCGSGLKTVMLATQGIQTGDIDLAVAGGMENMTLTPYALDKARSGYRMGHGKLMDLMVNDGLWDIYNDFHMGKAGELCAKEYQFSREEQDRYAKQSYERALASVEAGLFKDEIIGVEVKSRKETKLMDTDEEPFRAKMDKFGSLRPVFDKDGTITAANASPLSDGAAALVVSSFDKANELGLNPIAKVLAQASHAQAPEWFTTAPVGAVQKLLKKANLKASDIDLWEINEAFAVVALSAIKELKLDEAQVNIRGGAIALGHPLGASGAKILTTLIHSLHKEGKRLGVATLCIGGGEASALLVEAL